MTDTKEAGSWIVYMIRCRSNALYTGITNNLERRFSQHKAGTGAKYLRGKGPLSIVYIEQIETKPDALRRESEIKSFSKQKKEMLISSDQNLQNQ